MAARVSHGQSQPRRPGVGPALPTAIYSRNERVHTQYKTPLAPVLISPCKLFGTTSCGKIDNFLPGLHPWELVRR